MTALFRRLPWSLGQPRPGRGPVARIDAAFRLWREREDLDRLDQRMLRDVGLTAEDVRRERDRPVWDAPSWWHRAP